MRVLAITNLYPPHHYGGYEITCREVVTHLERSGHAVLVLTSDVAVPGVEAPAEDPSEVRRRLRLYWDDHVVLRPPLRECLRMERNNQQVLAEALDDHRPDVVSAWHMGGMSFGLLTACRRRGLPIVHVVSDDWLVYGPIMDRWTKSWRRAGVAGRLAERVLGVPCRLPDVGAGGAFCFISAWTRRAAEEHGGWRFPLSTVSYCGVNAEVFPVGAIPPRDAWRWRLLMVGRIDDRKGIDTAMRALAALPAEATLVIDGRGDDRERAALEVLAGSLGIRDRVRFELSDRGDLPGQYGAADVLLFPPRWAEPFGLVPLEAMACATPVVGTGTGGTGEFLLDGANCLRVPVDDHAALAAAVRRLADDAELRRRVVSGGLRTATELTLERWAALIEAWHISATTGFAQPPPPRPPIGALLAGRVSDQDTA